MKRRMVVLVLAVLLVAPAFAGDLADTGKAAGETVDGAFEWVYQLLEHMTPTHIGAGVFTDGDVASGVECVGFEVGQWKNRSGYIDGLLTARQEIRGCALTVEPFSGNNLAIGPAYYQDAWGALAVWHIEF